MGLILAFFLDNFGPRWTREIFGIIDEVSSDTFASLGLLG